MEATSLLLHGMAVYSACFSKWSTPPLALQKPLKRSHKIWVRFQVTFEPIRTWSQGRHQSWQCWVMSWNHLCMASLDFPLHFWMILKFQVPNEGKTDEGFFHPQIGVKLTPKSLNICDLKLWDWSPEAHFFFVVGTLDSWKNLGLLQPGWFFGGGRGEKSSLLVWKASLQRGFDRRCRSHFKTLQLNSQPFFLQGKLEQQKVIEIAWLENLRCGRIQLKSLGALGWNLLADPLVIEDWRRKL